MVSVQLQKLQAGQVPSWWLVALQLEVLRTSQQWQRVHFGSNCMSMIIKVRKNLSIEPRRLVFAHSSSQLTHPDGDARSAQYAAAFGCHKRQTLPMQKLR